MSAVDLMVAPLVCRVYVYDEVRKRFHLAGGMDHHQWCLFTIHHTIVHPPASGHLQCPSAGATSFVFVGSAEGTVSVWDLTKPLQEWIAEKAAHFRHVGSERNETTTASQASHTEATSSEGALPTKPYQSPTSAGVQKEPPMCHQNEAPASPDLSLPSVPLQEGDGEALAGQLAQYLEFSAASSETAGENNITESTDEVSAITPPLPDSVSNYEPAAEMTKNTPGKEEGGGRSGAVKLSPSLVLSVHQSGVNAVDVCLVDGKQCLYVVLSGGDDTAITASLCRLHPQDIAMVTKKTHPSAHFSAVTGKLEVLVDLPQY